MKYSSPMQSVSLAACIAALLAPVAAQAANYASTSYRLQSEVTASGSATDSTSASYRLEALAGEGYSTAWVASASYRMNPGFLLRGDTVNPPTPIQSCTGSDLSLHLSATPLVAMVGDRITFQARVYNNGCGTAQTVQSQYILPAGTTLAGVPAGCAEATPGVLTCTAPSLGSLHSLWLDIPVTVGSGAGATLTLTGRVSTVTQEDNTGNNDASATVRMGNLTDTDGDGLPDEWELANGLNPFDNLDAGMDPDRDGYSNLEEYQNGTAPQADDSDGDGLSDRDEAGALGSDPLDNDSDGDGLLDGWESTPTAKNFNACGDGTADVELANRTLQYGEEFHCETSGQIFIHTSFRCTDGAKVGLVANWIVPDEGYATEPGCRMHWVTPERAMGRSHQPK